MLLALAALTVLPLQDADPRHKPVWVAVTESGVRLECAGSVEPGDREIPSPFGVYRCPTDPVAKVVNSAALVKGMQALRAAPGDGFETWLRRVSEEGLLTELAEGVADGLRIDPGNLPAFEELEKWGARLDPAPPSLPMDKRVEWFWGRVLNKKPTEATLVAARLAATVPRGDDAAYTQTVSLGALQKNLRHRAPHVRRAAARIAGTQQVYDLLRNLMLLSVRDPVHAVRDGAAYATSRIHQHDSRQYWTLVLARGPVVQRVQAAQNLGRYGGQEALAPLVTILSAHERTQVGFYDYAGLQIHLVRDRQANVSTGGLDGNPYDLNVLSQGSRFKVTLLEDGRRSPGL